MKYKIRENGKYCTHVEEVSLEVCTVYGSDSNKVAKRIVTALTLLDKVEKGSKAEINQLIAEIKNK